MDAKEFLKSLDPEIPENPHVTVHLKRGKGQDTVMLTECVNPTFDMQLLCEGLATAIVVAAKYQTVAPEHVLQEVVHNLEQAVRHHGTIIRNE